MSFHLHIGALDGAFGVLPVLSYLAALLAGVLALVFFIYSQR